MRYNKSVFSFAITIIIALISVKVSHAKPSVPSAKASEIISQLSSAAVKTIIERIISENNNRAQIDGRAMGSSFFGRNSKDKLRNPMRPVDPLPVGQLDYFTPVINLINNVKKLDHNLKKQTYSYGLMVVGRPLEELTLPQKFVRAALMPGKYYHDATQDIAKQFNKYLLTEKKTGKSYNSGVKSKNYNSSGKKSNDIQWANVLLQLLNFAANAIPTTPVVKS